MEPVDRAADMDSPVLVRGAVASNVGPGASGRPQASRAVREGGEPPSRRGRRREGVLHAAKN